MVTYKKNKLLISIQNINMKVWGKFDLAKEKFTTRSLRNTL